MINNLYIVGELEDEALSDIAVVEARDKEDAIIKYLTYIFSLKDREKDFFRRPGINSNRLCGCPAGNSVFQYCQ